MNKEITPLTNRRYLDGCRWAYNEEDVKLAVQQLKDRIENAQEDCGNLDWVSKDQAEEIIDKIFGDLAKEEAKR